MPRTPLSPSRIAAIVALSLTGVGLTSCAAGGSSPQEVFAEYIAALNEGDYERALEMVADPGEVTPENIRNFTGFAYKEPLLRGEPLDPAAESGTLGMDLEGSPVPVPVEKRDGRWKLSRPVALTRVDFTDRFAAFGKFARVGEVSFTAQNGEQITEPVGFSMLPPEQETAQKITVAIKGGLIPDQTYEASAGQLGDGWPADEVDLGELPAKVSGLADSLRYIDSHYDVKRHEYVTQAGPIAIGECSLRPDSGPSSPFVISCAITHPEKDFDGNAFLRRGYATESVSDKSRYDNLWEYSVRAFGGGCVYDPGAEAPAGEPETEIQIRVQDGVATIVWPDVIDDLVPGFTSAGRLEERAVKEECSGWSPERVGDVIHGIAPRDSDAEGTEVSLRF